MSEAVAVRFSRVGKVYKLFASRTDNFLDVLGVGRLLPWPPVRYREFWALRGIDLELRRGERIGIVGRNGAGKTTLLRLVTGNLAATEGTIEVNGQVQALLESGGGLHPEFTGSENVRAALTYQGLTSAEIREAEDEIADFTELGTFLEQPFKMYSLGMQARLAFAVATAIRPEILIIDEILGAGDAYFLSKSARRMQNLVESGASVLIVSHALDQIARFCDTTVWLERGRIVERGPTPDVVRSYEKFIRSLEDRRLRGKSRRLQASRRGAVEHDAYGDYLVLRLTLEGKPGDHSDVSEIRLFRGDELEDWLLVGEAQDADTAQSSFVQLDQGEWSAPRGELSGLHRSLVVSSGPGPGSASGRTVFYLWSLSDDVPYWIDVRYRCSGSGPLSLEVLREGVLATHASLPAPAPDWAWERVEVKQPEAAASAIGRRRAHALDVNGVTRWPGERSLMIEDVVLLDGQGRESAVFHTDTPMSVRVRIAARRSGTFPLLLAGLVFRLDGIVVTRHVGEKTVLDLEAHSEFDARLDLGPLSLGNGYYALSVGLYQALDLHDVEPSRLYDYLDRSYEFRVVGAPRLHNELVRHPGAWELVLDPDSPNPKRIPVAPLWVPEPTSDTDRPYQRIVGGGGA